MLALAAGNRIIVAAAGDCKVTATGTLCPNSKKKNLIEFVGSVLKNSCSILMF